MDNDDANNWIAAFAIIYIVVGAIIDGYIGWFAQGFGLLLGIWFAIEVNRKDKKEVCLNE